jgi:ubiquitin-conjugating enzyme E2 variant
LSLIVSDFLSGILHWFGDSYKINKILCVKYPFLNTLQIEFFNDFKIHHDKPYDIYQKNTILYNIGYIALVPLVLCIFGLLIRNLLFKNFIMYLMIFLFFTNIFHRLAHLQKNNKLPYIISLLMDYWPFLNSNRHQKHHEYPQIKSYCITSGLLNPLLDKIKFFDKIEYIIYSITGIKSEFYDIKFCSKK